jgi:ABC-2 type transport system ATP-binding protein
MNITPAIDVQNITKYFNKKCAVNNLTMQIAPGEVFGFLGPNGSGKTTAIRMMCGLLIPDSGNGHCCGFNIIKETSKIKHQIGYMPQKFSLYDDLTIKENLDFMARVYQITDRHAAVNNTLFNLKLTQYANQLTGTLSGGWKQRLALAACLLHHPKILLLDEPTAGVDPKARREFWKQIRTIANNNVSILVSTHYIDEAEHCDRLGYIAYGNLIAIGTSLELTKKFNLPTLESVFINLMDNIKENII